MTTIHTFSRPIAQALVTVGRERMLRSQQSLKMGQAKAASAPSMHAYLLAPAEAIAAAARTEEGITLANGQCYLLERDKNTDQVIYSRRPDGSFISQTAYNFCGEDISAEDGPDASASVSTSGAAPPLPVLTGTLLVAISDGAGSLFIVEKCLLESTSSSSSSSGSDSAGSTSQACVDTLDGVLLVSLPVVTEADYGLVLKDGCLSLMEIGPCEEESGSGS